LIYVEKTKLSAFITRFLIIYC